MSMGNKLCALVLALLLAASGFALAEETPVLDDESFMTCLMVDGTMNAVKVLYQDGHYYTFSLDDETDKSGLADGLMIGDPIVVTYSGVIDWENCDASGVRTLAIADASFTDLCVPFTDAAGIEADLDGDGATELISLTMAPNAEMGDDTVVLRAGDASFATDICNDVRAILCDVDPADGKLDIFVSGDVMSDDYITWWVRYDAGALSQQGDVINGRLVSYLYGVATVCDWCNVLGTRWSETSFALNEAGKLEMVEGELWETDLDLGGDWESALETKIALPVTLLGDSGETSAELPAGTKLMIVATDGSSCAYFLTPDMQYGYIAITPSAEGWGFDIGGVFETEYFVNVPYAG